MELSNAYDTLGLEFKSPISKVKNAFKELSLKYHPDKNPNVDRNKFDNITKAFKYILTFKELDTIETPTQPIYQLPTNEYDLWLTLEEILSGNDSKSVQITRKIIDENRIQKHEKVYITVPVKPGLTETNRITVNEEGDQEHGKIAANAVFIVRQERHKIFSISPKSKYDLEYTAKLSNQDAFLGCKLKIPTLENEPVEIEIREIVTENTVRKIEERGLPYPDLDGKRGDLYVFFDIIIESKPKDPPMEQNLNLTLEQILNGCVKKFKIPRWIIDLDGEEKFEDHILIIDVKPGTETGTKISFLCVGDQNPETIPADLILTVCDKPHSTFKRDGVDIVYTALITSEEAILGLGCSLSIPTLENDLINISLYGVIGLETKHRIPNSGLPYSNNPKKRGDLLVQFEIAEQDDPIEIDVYLTPEEIHRGCTKQMNFTKNISNLSGNQTKENKTFTIEIEPRTAFGTKFPFPREGDQNPGKIPANVVYILCTAKLQLFTRIGNDIEYSVWLTAKEAQDGFELKIPSLESDPIKFYLENVYEDCRYCFRYRGLSVTANHIRGDLSVSVKLIRPILLIETSVTLKEILYGCTKNVHVERKIIDQNNNQKLDTKIFKILIKPGTPNGTMFSFPLEGDHIYGRKAGDVQIKVFAQSHPIFQRLNDVDIQYWALGQNLYGNKLEIPTLEGSTQTLDITQEMTNQDVERIHHLGLPHLHNKNLRGDLVVRFARYLFDYESVSPDLPQDSPIVRELQFSLDEILKGRTKNVKITRKIYSNESAKYVDNTKIVQIEIVPGTENGHKFTFPREGDHKPGTIPADVVFVVKYKPHDLFVPQGMDLIYETHISTESLTKKYIVIPTLDGYGIPLKISESILRDKTKRIPAYGLPNMLENDIRGDLVVHFIASWLVLKNLNSLDGNSHSKSSSETYEVAQPVEETPKPTFLRNTRLNTNRDNDRRKSQLAPAALDLPLTIPEMANGCTKERKIRRQIWNQDGTMQFENKLLTIDIKPGTEIGDRIVIKEVGDQANGLVPADVVFIVKAKF